MSLVSKNNAGVGRLKKKLCADPKSPSETELKDIALMAESTVKQVWESERRFGQTTRPRWTWTMKQLLVIAEQQKSEEQIQQKKKAASRKRSAAKPLKEAAKIGAAKKKRKKQTKQNVENKRKVSILHA